MFDSFVPHASQLSPSSDPSSTLCSVTESGVLVGLGAVLFVVVVIAVAVVILVEVVVVVFAVVVVVVRISV